jgi:hypothetical protein
MAQILIVAPPPQSLPAVDLLADTRPYFRHALWQTSGRTTQAAGEGEVMQEISCIALVVGVLAAIFWMIVGWRAMRAHEKLAEELQHIRQFLSQWLSRGSQE